MAVAGLAVVLMIPPAAAESWVYAPMELWFGADPWAMGWPVAVAPAPDPRDPVRLLEHGARVAADAGYELDYHDRNNDAYATRVRLLGLLRETDPAARPYALAVQTERSRWNYEALDGGTYDASQSASQEAAGAAARVASAGYLGIGVERGYDGLKPLFGAALDISDQVRVEMRSVERRVSFPISYVDSENSIDTALTSRRRMNEVGLDARVPEWGEVSMRLDVNQREHASMRWELSVIPGHRVIYEYLHEENPVASDIRVNGDSSGEVFGALSLRSYGLRVLRRGEARDWHVGVKKTTVRLDLNGGVTDDDLIDLWAYLLPGERRFKAKYAADIVQWFIGAETRASESWTTRAGMQYTTARANGNFSHWTPIPLLGVGKLDEENKPLSNERSSALGVSLGATYRVARWEFTYAIAQLIPLDASGSGSSRSSSPDSTAVAARRSGAARSRASGDQASGGHIQQLRVVRYL